MKCPLKFRLLDYGAEIERIYTGDCLKEECASWDEELECCGEVSKRVSLKLIAELLRELVNKMPSATQFVTKP